jgi:hypothetical protein
VGSTQYSHRRLGVTEAIASKRRNGLNRGSVRDSEVDSSQSSEARMTVWINVEICSSKLKQVRIILFTVPRQA